MPTIPEAPKTDALPSEAGDGQTVYHFGEFHLDPLNRLLRHGKEEIPLPGRAFDLLLELVRHPGKLLTKEELLTRVWDGAFVEESNLTVAMSTLRRALNEDPQERRFVQTVARRGYRFIAEVSAEAAAAAPSRLADAVGHSLAVADTQEIAEVPRPQPAPTPVPAYPESSRKLTWPFIALYGFLLALLAAGAWMLLKPRTPLKALAVLPLRFEGSGTSPGEVELLGMTDDLVTRLGSGMVVRPTSSVLRYSAMNAVDPALAGREQDVDAVLTGTMSQSNAGEQLELRLVRTSDGITLWKGNYHAGSPAELIEAASAGVGHELQHLGAAAPPKPREPESPLARANQPAYQLYLRGRYFWNLRTPDGMRKSVESFQQAIDADPNFAPAYAGLADSYALLASFSLEPGSTANANARSAALSAIQLDPSLAEPHASLGMILFFTDWNLAGAEREFERAISLNPNYATAHHWYALDLAAMGRFPQAEYEIRLAQKLDPLSLIINTNVGWVETLAHNRDGARHDLQRVLDLDPNFARARTRLGMLELSESKPTDAVRDLTSALTTGDQDPYVEGLLGDAQAQAGDHAGAERTLADLRRRSGTQYVPPISEALVLIGLGRKAEAIEALKRSVADHSTSVVYAKVDPTLDPLRSEPAFQQLLAHSGL